MHMVLLVSFNVYATREELRDNKILMSVILAFCAIFLVRELLQILGRHCSYLMDPFNYPDIGMIACCTISVLSSNVFTSWDLTLQWPVVVGILLLYTRGISYFRLWGRTRHLIRSITETFYDMIPFVLIMIVLVAAYATLYVACFEPAEIKEFDYSIRLFKGFEILLGGYEDPENGPHYFVFIVMLIITLIVLLNMLIAIMGDTFGRVQSNTVVYDYRERLSVNIDQEAARISEALDRQIDAAIKTSADLHSSEIVLPDSDARKVPSPGTGYVNSIEADLLVKAAAQRDAMVVFAVQPGDFLIQTDELAHVIGDSNGELDSAIKAAAPLIPARDPNGDIRFSVHLLVEIALRALSPGVNDTFTAIVCIDRLSASLCRAWTSELCAGVYRDDVGAVRVVYPSITARSLFLDSLPPLRRAARGNGLVTEAIIRALERISRAAREKDREAITCELQAIGDETRQSEMLEREIEQLCERIQDTIASVNGAADQRSAKIG